MTQTNSLHIFGLIPFVKLQNDTKTTVKRFKTMKNEIRKEITFCCGMWVGGGGGGCELLFSCSVLGRKFNYCLSVDL